MVEFASIIKYTPKLECFTIIGVRTCNRPLFEALAEFLKQFCSSLLCLKQIVLNCFLLTHNEPHIHVDKRLWNHLERALIKSEECVEAERMQRRDKPLLTLDLDFSTKEKHGPLPDNYSFLYHTIEEKVLDALPQLASRNIVHVYRSVGRWYGIGGRIGRVEDRDFTSQ